ncbi:glutathione S-transferase family protein [Roseicyclus marinus]|uniref:glutathione S-transferase family protein n=1 Tax=Roseicyclus marinus TaxID=2161673 RepID=UPI0024107023|nr:glutathione S-transferase family protein [Roseicyclus marinus]MDG3042237.1 glutathione S-transferase family protein [Roseicyclus marinus]
MPDLTLYTNPMSRGRIARWMMEEAGLPYEARIVAYGPEMKSPAYRALNPMGKVPTLVHGDTAITEVAAICTYMAELAPDAGLIPPPATPERGSFYRWMFFAAGSVDPAVSAASLGLDTSDPQVYRRVGWGTVEAVADTLAGLLSDGRPYLLGERFSAVDICLGSQIVWGLQYNSLPARDGFAAYAARITDRDAAQRAAAIDDALIPAPEPGTGT